MTDVVRIDPRTAEVVEVIAREDTTQDVDRAGERVAAAARPLDELGRSGRPATLRAMADQLEVHDDEIVGIADRETGIGPVRLEVPSLRPGRPNGRLGKDAAARGAVLVPWPP
jgi:NADP-dependent aldehyde dehydrogenase